MLQDKVSKSNFELIKDFIRAESRDYSKISDENRDDWINKRVELISKGLPEKGNRLRFSSLNNAGEVIRQLTLDFGKGYWDWKSPNVEVTFCTCGKETCWGSVSEGLDSVGIRVADGSQT